MKEIFIDDVLSSEGLALLTKRVRRSPTLTIALMASEACKDILAKFVIDHEGFFAKHALVATSGTTTEIRRHSELEIESVGHGPSGGDVIVAHKILTRQCDVLLFFRSGHEVLPHEDDMRMLVRVANMSNCIVAQNVATASLVLIGLEELLSREQERSVAPAPQVRSRS
jgi:methylglyoxal synthase